MFCPGCATRLDDIGAFCPICGRDLQSLKERVGAGYPEFGNYLAIPWRGKQVVMGLALVGIAFLVISGGTVILERLGAGLAWGAWLGSHAIGLVILGAVWLLGQDKGRMSLASLGLRRPRTSWPIALFLSGGALAVSIGFAALYALAMKPLGIDLLLPPDVPKDVIFGGYAVIWTFEALAGWTPLTEEIFFRGFVMPGLVARWGVMGAAVASALIFSLFHLHPGVLVPIFFTGLLLAALFHFTGSLWPPVIAHAGQNTVALVAIMYGV